MRKYGTAIVGGLLVLAIAGGGVFFLGRPPKIGIVDNTVILAQFSEAIKARQSLEAQEAEWKKNLASIQDSLQAVMDTLTVKYPQAKEADRKSWQEKLNRWNSEYNRYMAAVEKARPEKQKEILNPVLEKVNGFVKNWARENGYEVILGTGNGGVVLSVSEAYNVSSQVVMELNKLYSGSATAPDSALRSAAAGAK